MSPDKMVELKIADLIVGEYQTRVELDDDRVQDIVASIRRVGLLNPLLVAAAGDKFVVVAGHHRLRAVKLCGHSKVKCIVQVAEDSQIKEIAIADNLFRSDLSPIEVAAAMQDILTAGPMDVEELARAMHRTKEWVTRQISMLSWPDDVLEVVHNGKLAKAAASNLALVSDAEYRRFLLKNAVDSGATARATAAWLQAWRSAMPAEAAVQEEPVAGSAPATPALPQAPCLCCGQMHRTDSLAYVLVCGPCVGAIRGANQGA